MPRYDDTLAFDGKVDELRKMRLGVRYAVVGYAVNIVIAWSFFKRRRELACEVIPTAVLPG